MEAATVSAAMASRMSCASERPELAARRSKLRFMSSGRSTVIFFTALYASTSHGASAVAEPGLVAGVIAAAALVVTVTEGARTSCAAQIASSSF